MSLLDISGLARPNRAADRPFSIPVREGQARAVDLRYSGTIHQPASDSGAEDLRYTVEEVDTTYRPTPEQHLGPNPPQRILALDGDGVRGILTLGSAQYRGTISDTLFN